MHTLLTPIQHEPADSNLIQQGLSKARKQLLEMSGFLNIRLIQRKITSDTCKVLTIWASRSEARASKKRLQEILEREMRFQ